MRCWYHAVSTVDIDTSGLVESNHVACADGVIRGCVVDENSYAVGVDVVALDRILSRVLLKAADALDVHSLIIVPHDEIAMERLFGAIAIELVVARAGHLCWS